jgi:hypothetical protein
MPGRETRGLVRKPEIGQDIGILAFAIPASPNAVAIWQVDSVWILRGLLMPCCFPSRGKVLMNQSPLTQRMAFNGSHFLGGCAGTQMDKEQPQTPPSLAAGIPPSLVHDNLPTFWCFLSRCCTAEVGEVMLRGGAALVDDSS